MQSAPLAGTATTVTVVFMVLVLDAIRTPRGDGNTSSKSFLSVARRCNPQTPSHLPIPSRFASANRGASSKAARSFRHRRRFASFLLRGRQRIDLAQLLAVLLDAIRTPRGDGNNHSSSSSSVSSSDAIRTSSNICTA